MKGIMFNTKYGLEQAVLNGTKTRTWRADKEPRYKIGEVVAIKQCYCDVLNYHKEQNNITLEQRIIAYYSGEKGWRNKDEGMTWEHYIPYNHLNANRIKCGGIYISLSKRRYKKHMLNLMNFEINR